jgi:hypothetical protein
MAIFLLKSNSMKTFFALTLTIALAGCFSVDSSTEKKAQAEIPKTIPGIAAFDIYSGFEQKGFSIDKKFNGSNCSFTCNQVTGDKVYNVDVFGTAPQAIDKVKASVVYKKADKDAIAFLGQAASVRYKGSDPEAALSWTADHFKNGGDTTIGTVRFVLTADSATARVLALYPH